MATVPMTAAPAQRLLDAVAESRQRMRGRKRKMEPVLRSRSKAAQFEGVRCAYCGRIVVHGEVALLDKATWKVCIHVSCVEEMHKLTKNIDYDMVAAEFTDTKKRIAATGRFYE